MTVTGSKLKKLLTTSFWPASTMLDYLTAKKRMWSEGVFRQIQLIQRRGSRLRPCPLHASHWDRDRDRDEVARGKAEEGCECGGLTASSSVHSKESSVHSKESSVHSEGQTHWDTHTLAPNVPGPVSVPHQDRERGDTEGDTEGDSDAARSGSEKRSRSHSLSLTTPSRPEAGTTSSGGSSTCNCNSNALSGRPPLPLSPPLTFAEYFSSSSSADSSADRRYSGSSGRGSRHRHSRPDSGATDNDSASNH